MTKRNDKDFDQFFDFLEATEEKNPKELWSHLAAVGIDVDRAKSEMSDIISKARQAYKLRWLEDARKKQSVFEEKLRVERASILDRYPDTKALIAGVRMGKFGTIASARAGVFFRSHNFDGMSDRDIRSFLEDCDLLALLTGERDEKK